jgi:hypothetical protein
MGDGCYWILIWDEWGVGLNMLNPRLLSRVGRPPKRLEDQTPWVQNAWDDTREGLTDEEIDEKHRLTDRFGHFWKVVR